MRRVLHTGALALLLIVIISACAKTTTAPTTTSAPSTTSTSTTAPPSTTKPVVTTASGQAPKYGGTLNISAAADIPTFDDANQGGPGGYPSVLFGQELWGGDWAKGPAGGYGTNATDWAILGYDNFANKTGYLAQSWAINVNSDQAQATIVYEIRPGVQYALDPNSAASKQVNGRELTVADILAAIKQSTTDPKGYIYRSNPDLRNLDVSQTGPMEITVHVPITSLVTALSRLGNSLRVYPMETRDEMTDWKNAVGTGPFMLTGYVSGSSLTFTRNPNYWMKDPVGPGKGNQLPYVDGVQVFILPDPSTRLAAFRTGKIDESGGIAWEDSAQLKKEFPQMPSAQGDYSSPGGPAMYMRTDKPPYNDVNVRRALMMATDFNSIKQNFNGGNGIIITFPYQDYTEYHALYAGIDDPDLPQSVKDQFVYSPDKAKALLAQAGFPNGFKTSVLCLSSQSSYIEMIAGMWAKAGITVNIDVKDATVATNVLNSQGLTDITTAGGYVPTPVYYNGTNLNGVAGMAANPSYINDLQVQAWLPQIRTLAATDPAKAMAVAKQMMIRALDQAWVIQIPKAKTTTFWQPWVKNYSGEFSVGYNKPDSWPPFIWLDQTLKKSMGH
jgi:peptide/nickel transport system substrate-binding protein